MTAALILLAGLIIGAALGLVVGYFSGLLFASREIARSVVRLQKNGVTIDGEALIAELNRRRR